MTLTQRIESPQNARIKELVKLRSRSSLRKERSVFLVEGRRECELALKHGFVCESLFLREGLGQDLLSDQAALEKWGDIFFVHESAYRKIAVREEGECIAVMQMPQAELPAELDLSLPLCIASDLEKPGNLGAIFRSAAGAGTAAIIACGKQLDLYSPNVIRASLGTIFSLPAVSWSPERAVKYCRERGIRVVAAEPSASASFTDLDYSGPTAFVVGSEAFGLGSWWLEEADDLVAIPMYCGADSLNVSVAAALLLYEAQRQRKLLENE